VIILPLEYRVTAGQCNTYVCVYVNTVIVLEKQHQWQFHIGCSCSLTSWCSHPFPTGYPS